MKVTQSPQPTWRPGTPVESPVREMVTVDTTDLDALSSYKLLIGSVVPRPIAFITTLSSNGSVNAAPYSSWNLVSSKPTTVVFSIAVKPNGDKKDTLINIERTKEFVINTVGDWMVEAMNHCAADMPYGESELKTAGLTTVPSDSVAVPRIMESPIHIECRLHSVVHVGDGAPGSATVVIGEALRFHIHKAAYQDGKIVVEELRPVSRLGGLRYALIGDIFELPRANQTRSDKTK